ncbi:hypothetical protein SAMN04488000_1283 [Lentzea albida]|uniref:Uncharacterized protein n=1 Tax=Lentzea albida TaxID=65499 RepID=A0A1H9X5N5_9PSEU|nr:hypothetical protein SAMN04488000_1283 [Lentzea albida]
MTPRRASFSVDAPIAPRGVFGRETQDKAADRCHGARTSAPSTPVYLGVATLHQVTMPSQHRIQADQQSESAQSGRSQRRQERGKERPVRRSELRASVAELALQDGGLVAKSKNLNVLLAVSQWQ